ncbi:MAG TPA: GAP family protein [Solirubrobacterales bacterium]|nr:GAP family protein [Solirubrobacterales bacterium]
MADAIGQSLSFAVGVAISPVPIIGVVLMLGTPRARSNGLSFLAGWIGGIAVVGAVILVAAGGIGPTDGGQPADWVSVLKLLLAAVLVRVAFRQWRGRPREGAEPELPKWMETIDGFTAAKAGGFGVLLASINPKNLLLVVAGAAAIAQTDASTGDQAVALAVFAAVASVGVGTPLAIYLGMGDRADRILAEFKGWMGRHNAAIMAAICLIIAAKLVGDALSALG